MKNIKLPDTKVSKQPLFSTRGNNHAQIYIFIYTNESGRETDELKIYLFQQAAACF